MLFSPATSFGKDPKYEEKIETLIHYILIKKLMTWKYCHC